MKWYKKHFGFGFANIILVAFVLQSVHSYEHLRKVFTEKQCHHIYAKNKTVIGHKHLELDHCFSCEFTFSNAINTPNSKQKCEFNSANHKLQFVTTFDYNSFFNGSSFFLRGPPIV